MAFATIIYKYRNVSRYDVKYVYTRKERKRFFVIIELKLGQKYQENQQNRPKPGMTQQMFSFFSRGHEVQLEIHCKQSVMWSDDMCHILLQL